MFAIIVLPFVAYVFFHCNLDHESTGTLVPAEHSNMFVQLSSTDKHGRLDCSRRGTVPCVTKNIRAARRVPDEKDEGGEDGEEAEQSREEAREKRWG